MLLINFKAEFRKQNRCVEEMAWKEAFYLRTLMYFVHFWQFTPCGLFQKNRDVAENSSLLYVIFSCSGELFRRFGEPRVLLDPEYEDTTIIKIVWTYLHRLIPETGICSVISMSVRVVKFKLGWFDIPRGLNFSLSFIPKISELFFQLTWRSRAKTTCGNCN
jgi:hypothetical protein